MIPSVDTGPIGSALEKKGVEKSQLKCYNVNQPTVTIDEYRKILGDNQSNDEQIQKRIEFIEGLCRKAIRLELEQHAINQPETVK